MSFDNVAVVVPTIREANIRQFLDAWRFPCRVIVVEDNPEPTFDLGGDGIEHYAWSDIEADLGADSWIIPRRSDCVRSYGYWKAWQTGAEVIVTLDDDCLPVTQDAQSNTLAQQFQAEIRRLLAEGDVIAAAKLKASYAATEPEGMASSAEEFLAGHIANLSEYAAPRWHSTTEGLKPRGYPYKNTHSIGPVGISHGLWVNVPDYDAITQLHARRYGLSNPRPAEGLVPRGSYYPMCGMNLAWRREFTPLLYFLLMGQDAHGNPYPYDRFGDIWAGVISKKILDHLGVGVYSGSPVVRHERASNVWANLRKEAPGLEANEVFWQWIDAAPLEGDDLPVLYYQIAGALRGRGEYWDRLAKAMMVWGGLYA